MLERLEFRRCFVDASDVSVVPVGKVKSDEVEAALARAARVLRFPVELKGPLPVPQGIEDRERGQFRAERSTSE